MVEPAVEGEGLRPGRGGRGTSLQHIQGSTVWRVSLRSFTFLDKKPPPGDVPGDLLDEIRSHLDDLRAAWNRMYPDNPV